MKTLARTLLVACTLAIPAVSFAQSVDQNGPVTRAEVRADLVRVEKAGFTPLGGDNYSYPAAIQRAEAKIAAQDQVATATAPSLTPGVKLVAANTTHQHYRIDDARSVYTDGA
ncbi:DUF4148 domain-containing protein [Cupriavidus plantarum]|uniref:DUF4148 domain-containing protein n=1 Tax=Cupriavidus plantarum TaxID=942865 RepID=UPI000EB2E10A|nr:DUF4148 domain-containing protein [Cupriavidus plantarum]RLK45039.1 uncharacterized protein DUF4148 [Cupriavidus plantarum]